MIDGADNALYSIPAMEPPRTVHAIKIVRLEGKGRGVVATRDVALGEVLLITPPTALLESAKQQRPSGELLVDKIIDDKLYTSAWFSVLWDGSEKSAKALPGLAPAQASDDGRPALPPEPLLASTSSPPAPQPQRAASGGGTAKRSRLAARVGPAGGGFGQASAASAAAAAAAAPSKGGGVAKLERREIQRLAKLVKYNCFGDGAAAAAPAGWLGLHVMLGACMHAAATARPDVAHPSCPRCMQLVPPPVHALSPRHLGQGACAACMRVALVACGRSVP